MMDRLMSRPGHPYPLGATWDGEGVNFALFSENATAVDLCLFDRPDQEKESETIRIEERTNQVWHVFLPDVRPGQLFGYRIGDPEGDLSFDERNNAQGVPKSVVIEQAFTWGDDRPLRRPWSETLIYE